MGVVMRGALLTGEGFDSVNLISSGDGLTVPHSKPGKNGALVAGATCSSPRRMPR